MLISSEVKGDIISFFSNLIKNINPKTIKKFLPTFIYIFVKKYRELFKEVPTCINSKLRKEE